MRLDTEISTSQGVCHCTIKRVLLEGAETVEVDLWRTGEFLLSQITMFSADVFMKWNGRGYVIKRRKQTDYTSDYWIELENIISNLILVNE